MTESKDNKYGKRPLSNDCAKNCMNCGLTFGVICAAIVTYYLCHYDEIILPPIVVYDVSTDNSTGAIVMEPSIGGPA